jgi:hypothetical protein
MKAKASSACVGPVREGLRTMMGLEVFFWRMWYFLEPKLRRAYPGIVAVEGEEIIVRLDVVSWSDVKSATL